MVDDLTEKGYVIRERDLADRRKYLINITEDGVGLASDFMGKLSFNLQEKFIKLTEEERIKYVEAINTLQDILTKEELS